MATVTTTTTTQVNGDVPSIANQSAFLSHLLNYPVVSDGIHVVKSNGYGQRSIEIGDSAYHTIYTRIAPYLTKPYQYVSPYVAKADTLGDQTLDKIDERFPVVKKPTSDIYNETRSLVLLPYSKGLESKEHVLQIYSSEYKKLEQQGLVAQGRAALITALVVSNETLTWFSSFLKQKTAQTTSAVSEKVAQ